MTIACNSHHLKSRRQFVLNNSASQGHYGRIGPPGRRGHTTQPRLTMAAKKSPPKQKPKSEHAPAHAGGLDFEEALNELENLVNKMEAGDLSLEQSLQAFEEGVKLTREAQARLNAAEQRVKILMEEQGELVEADFDEDDED